MVYDKLMDVEQFNETINDIQINLNLQQDKIKFPDDIIQRVEDNILRFHQEKLSYDNYMKEYFLAEDSNYEEEPQYMEIYKNNKITYIPEYATHDGTFPKAYNYSLPNVKTIYKEAFYVWVARDIKNINFPNVIDIYEGAFNAYYMTWSHQEIEVHLPKVKNIRGGAFGGLQFKTLILPNIKNIESSYKNNAYDAVYTFVQNELLTHLILPNKTIFCSLGMEAFKGTPIEKGEGFIYVPKTLYNDYINDNNGYESYFRIIEDYPEVQRMIKEEAKKYG